MSLKKIIVGTDFSEEADVALQHAIAIARHTGAELVLVHALSMSVADFATPYPVSIPPSYSKVVDEIREQARQKLAELRERHAGQGFDISHVFVDQMPAVGIAMVAKEMRADLVVVGSHGRGALGRLFLGSISQQVVKNADCDVLVARGPVPKDGYRNILVPTDFSELGDSAVGRAALLAERGGDVQVAHYWRLPNGSVTNWGSVGPVLRESLRTGSVEFGEKCLEKYRTEDANFAFFEQEAEPKWAIEEHVKENKTDMIVMGTHGRKGLQRMLLGSIAQSVLHHVNIPVYLTKTPREEE